MTDLPSDLPTAGRFDGRDHLLPVRVYYEDTDFTGLVYHANYVRYFERGRSDFLRAIGVGHADLLEEAEPLAFVVSELNIRYLKPARIDDALVVRTVYEAMGIRDLEEHDPLGRPYGLLDEGRVLPDAFECRPSHAGDILAPKESAGTWRHN